MTPSHVSLAGVLSSMVLTGAVVQAMAAPAKPNVLIVLTDDQGYGDMSCHGNPILKTPEMDGLYHQCVRL